jgi:hypothetical protein
MNARAMLDELMESLRPGVHRARALRRIDEMFREGSVPDPLPHGPCPGELVATSTWGPVDAVFQKIAGAWMPWKGKKFDADSGTGVNIMDKSARIPSRIVWPGYTPEAVEGDRMEMFPFRNRIAAGALDEDVKVYKIDYDFDANPKLIIRRILDELVQIDDDFYLGKILLRMGSGWRPIGFFSLTQTLTPR